MVRLLYTATLYCAAPFFLLRLVWRGFRNAAYWRRIGERFGFGTRIRAERGCVWIHAVSVGEVQAAAPIVKALKNHYPDETIVVTSTTPTGAARIAKAFGGGVVHRYFPFDFPGAMARFLRRVQPRVAIIMETEIWPNLLTLCRVRGVPVVLANVRLSERSAVGYRRVSRAFRAGPSRCCGDRGAERRGRPPNRLDRRPAGSHRRDRQHEVRRSGPREPARGSGGAAAHVGSVTRNLDRGEYARR